MPRTTPRPRQGGGGARRPQRGGGRRAPAPRTPTRAASSGPSTAQRSPHPKPPTTSPQPRLRVTDSEISANRRRARLICIAGGAGPAAVTGIAAGAGAGTIPGAITAAIVFAVVSIVIWRGASAFVVRLIRAQPLPEGACHELRNMVEGLCPTFGVRAPSLMLVDDPVPNACCFGGGPAHTRLAVTTGLMNRLGLIELEGVIGHELAHLKRHDNVVSAVAVAVVGPLAWLSGRDRWLHRAVGLGREYRADELAVAAVRYPPGLHDALVAIGNGPVPRPGSIFLRRSMAMTRWIWVDPAVGRSDEHPLGDLDLPEVRVAALAEW